MSLTPVSECDDRPVVESRQRQREETKRRLFEAALEIFRRDGVQSARIEDIAALAGTSRPAFYFHFRTREDVLIAVLEASEERVGRAVAELPRELELPEVFAAVARLIAEEWRDDPKLFAEVGAVALRRASVTAPAPDSSVRMELGRRMERAIERGEAIDAVPAQMLADLFLLNQFAVAFAWSSSPELPLAFVLEGAATLFLTGAQKDRREAR